MYVCMYSVSILAVCGTHNSNIPCAEIRKFFTAVNMRTPIHVCYFKSGQNRRRISGRKFAFYWLQKQHVLASLGETTGAISAVFLCECMRTVTPHLYSAFHPDSSGFGGDVTETPLPLAVCCCFRLQQVNNRLAVLFQF